MARRENQVQHTQPAEGEEVLDLGVALTQLHEELLQIQKRLGGLAQDDDASLQKLRNDLLRVQQHKVDPIIESRARAQASLGLTRYAEVFGLISQGERRLNRAWAALVDGHLGEASRSLDGATLSWQQAIEQLTQEVPSL